jgi:hypothetical protein
LALDTARPVPWVIEHSPVPAMATWNSEEAGVAFSLARNAPRFSLTMSRMEYSPLHVSPAPGTSCPRGHHLTLVVILFFISSTEA